MKREKNGFTLAELLIVVAIIAVLAAAAIPLFTSQLEKSREATDLSNVRAAYAEVMADAMSNHSTGTYSRTVPLKQKTKDWQTAGDITIGGITHTQGSGDTEHWKGIPDANGTCKVSYTDATGVVFDWNGGASTPGGTPSTAHYFTQIKSNYLDPNIDQIREFATANHGYTGFFIEYEDGSTGFISSIDDSSVGRSWPSGAVAAVITHDGTNYYFYNRDYTEEATWSIGDAWQLE